MVPEIQQLTKSSSTRSRSGPHICIRLSPKATNTLIVRKIAAHSETLEKPR